MQRNEFCCKPRTSSADSRVFMQPFKGECCHRISSCQSAAVENQTHRSIILIISPKSIRRIETIQHIHQTIPQIHNHNPIHRKLTRRTCQNLPPRIGYNPRPPLSSPKTKLVRSSHVRIHCRSSFYHTER